MLWVVTHTTAQCQLVVGSNRADNDYINQVFLGQGVTDSDEDLGTRSITLNATGGSGTNLQGASMNLAGGRSTGNAVGGSINFQISTPGSSGTSLNGLGTVAHFSGEDGSFTLQNITNSTSAFRILNADSTLLFQADTDNSRIYIGNPAGDTDGALLVLSTKTTAGDPAGTDGAMYYNGNSHRFRCFENGAWRDCVGGAPEVVTFTSDGTFEKADYPGVRAIDVQVVGGVGGATGAHATGTGEASAGQGGGGAGYARSFLLESQLAEVEDVTIGAGGIPGTGTNPAFAQSGGNSSFGELVVGEGGGAAFENIRAGSDPSLGRVSQGSFPGWGGGTGDHVVQGSSGTFATRLAANAIVPGIGGHSFLGANGQLVMT